MSRHGGETLACTREVTRDFGQGTLTTKVLRGIDLTVRAGELLLVMGPSGSGKTTLLSVLTGLLRPTSGHVELCGVAISAHPEEVAARMRRERLGFVFQTYNLFPALSALDNVAEPLRMRGVPPKEARARAQEALARVGLSHRLRYRPGELSGGQSQRVAIARALAGDPVLIIGDEITAALDSATGMGVMELIRAQVRPTCGVVLVTHDHRLERFADRIVEMEDGRIFRDRDMRAAGTKGA